MMKKRGNLLGSLILGLLILEFLILAAGIQKAYAIGGVKVELQFLTQTYRLNAPIPILVNVVNTSPEHFPFEVSPLIYQTFFFEIKTPRNEEILIKDIFNIEIQQSFSSSDDFRNVILNSGESFAKQIDITQWFDIREAGYYYIKGFFYPNPDDDSEVYESVYYKILIKPPLVVEEEISREEQLRLENLERVQSLPPYDVIADFIDAKMKKDWERFLIHIDSERLILSFQNFANEYENARTGRYRLELIEDFERYLTVHWQDTIVRYQVKQSYIEANEAEVTADVEIKVRNLTQILRYTFYLYKNHENNWLVYNYTVLRIQ